MVDSGLFTLISKCTGLFIIVSGLDARWPQIERIYLTHLEVGRKRARDDELRVKLGAIDMIEVPCVVT